MFYNLHTFGFHSLIFTDIDLGASPYKDTGVLECPAVSARHITGNRSKYYRESDRLRWLVHVLGLVLIYTALPRIRILTGIDLHTKFAHRYVVFSSF